MDLHAFLVHAGIFLGAAVVGVPLFKRLGLGSVLGYLAAGAALGPCGLKLVSDPQGVRHFAELGVVLLMFIVGLELLPSRLWEMRRRVFGLGGAQVVLSGLVLGAVGLALGLSVPTALVAGLGLALSSTAFALQLLAERNQFTTPQGRAAFGVLLFQDLAVIPMLAVLPLLAPGSAAAAGAAPAWVAVVKGLAAIVAVVLFGRYLLKPALRLIAASNSAEAFTASALALVIGIGMLLEAVGLSMAFGAFLAGVLLADSEYRHALEADIEPFKGLLLGIFFTAVGMTVDLGLVVGRPGAVAGLVLGLVAVKALVLYALGRVHRLPDEGARVLAVSISQGGEFAFVLFNVAVARNILERGLSDLLVVVVTLSMVVTPLLLPLNDRLSRRLARDKGPAPDERMPEEESAVIIAGFGRFGQMVGRILTVRKIPFTAIDLDPNHIQFVSRFGNKVYFGDVTRLDLLRAAKADKARIFVLAIDDVDASVKTAELVKHQFPNVQIFARARNRAHAYRLLGLGIQVVHRETFAAGLDAARDVLVAMGIPDGVSNETVRIFREYDERLMRTAAAHHQDLDKLIEIAAAGRQELDQLFSQDVR